MSQSNVYGLQSFDFGPVHSYRFIPHTVAQWGPEDDD